MTVLLKDLVDNPLLLSHLRGEEPKPLTYDQLWHDSDLETDTISEASDALYAKVADSGINPLATSAGIRRS